MKLLSKIAEELRARHEESEIVAMIKDRQVIDIEECGYTTQQNYPHGVFVCASGEDLDGVMFGHKGRGGKREGAGAPIKPANLKKNMISVKLPQWLVDWTKEQPESRAVLIEDALKKVHNLKTPPAG